MLRNCIFISFFIAIISIGVSAQDFDTYFTNQTLRLDYIFAGSATQQAVYLDGMMKQEHWAGRRSQLSELPYWGNGQIEVRDAATGLLIYCNSFSSLFQEWVNTPEAAVVARSYQNTFLVPMPKHEVDVSITLCNTYHKPVATLTHRVDPTNILIRNQTNAPQVIKLHKGGSYSECINIAIVSEGYSDESKATFVRDAKLAAKTILAHEPFKSYAKKFNIVAVFQPSVDDGVSVPRYNDWKQTAFGSHYSTFYSDRYLTTSSLEAVHDAIGTVPFEQIILLVNTERYGGGGIYNNITLCTSDHPFSPVGFVHEFGHSFAGLADEYDYGEEEDPTYPPDIEPWEPNITTLVDFAAKWQYMLPSGVKVPTAPDALERDNDLRRIWSRLTPEQKAQINSKLGVYEGAGYRAKGVYRPVQECRMRINECEEFCPVCTRAIERMTYYCTGALE